MQCPPLAVAEALAAVRSTAGLGWKGPRHQLQPHKLPCLLLTGLGSDHLPGQCCGLHSLASELGNLGQGSWGSWAGGQLRGLTICVPGHLRPLLKDQVVSSGPVTVPLQFGAIVWCS